MVRAALLLPLVALALRLFGFQKTYDWLDEPLPPNQSASPEATYRSVDLAARHIPFHRPTCLSRSLVLWHLLRRRGSPAEIRIGVQTADGQFRAHAWVEWDGKVINDAPDIALRFSPIDLSAYSNVGQ